MQALGNLIDKLEKNHKTATPWMIFIIAVFSLIALFTMPSYEEYCKEPQAQCKENK